MYLMNKKKYFIHDEMSRLKRLKKKTYYTSSSFSLMRKRYVFLFEKKIEVNSLSLSLSLSQK